MKRKVYLEDLCKTEEHNKWMKCLSLNPSCISFIRNPTYEMCLYAVKSIPSAISQIPTSIIDQKICELAIDQDGDNLEYVPKNFRSKSLILKAVRKSSRSIRFLSEDEIDLEIFKVALEKNDEVICIIKNPTEEMCKLSVEKSPYSLKYLKNPSSDVICVALKLKGDLLYWIAKEKQNLEMCHVAITQSKEAFRDVKIFSDLNGDMIRFTSHSEALARIESEIHKKSLKNKIISL